MPVLLPSRRAFSQVLLVTAVVVTGSLLSACTGSSGGGGASGSASTTPPDLSNVKIDLSNNAETIDPVGNGNLADNRMVALLQGRMFVFSAGSATKTEPSLATKATSSDGGKTWTIDLKSGLTFSDGSPLTSADVKSSVERLRTTKNFSASDAVNIADVQTPTPTQVIFTLKGADSDFTQTLAMPTFSIVPQAAAADPKYFDKTPLYSGPFVLQGDWKSTSFVVVRNDKFGGAKPAVQKISFTITSDPVSAVSRLQAGNIDVATDIPMENVSRLSGDVTGLSVSSLASMYLLPNNRAGKLFADVRIRQAIGYAIDRSAMAKLAFGETAKPQLGPYPVVASYPGGVVWSDKPDMDKAKQLLQGTACATECSFAATYFATESATAGRVATALAQELKPLNITVQPKPVETGTFIDNSISGNFEMNIATSAGFNVPTTFTGAFDQASGCIYTGCSNAEWDPAVAALLSASDQSALEAASTKVTDIFAAWQPILPVSGSTWLYGEKRNLVGVISIEPNGLFWFSAAK